MSAKEIEIIKSLKRCENKKYGGYIFWEDMQVAIARVMGYKVTRTKSGHVVSNLENVVKIVNGMEKRGILKKSKSGEMFKLTEA